MSTCDEPWCISFLAPLTQIDPAFWEELYERKLKIYKLDSEVEPISVYYSCSDGRNAESFVLEGSSFQSLHENQIQSVDKLAVKGILVNVNTIEEFKDYGKMALLNQSASVIWRSILSLEAVHNPHLLIRFVLLTFADLKLYRFTYWFGCPSLLPKSPFTSTFPVCLRDVSTMGCCDNTSYVLPVTVKDQGSILKEDCSVHHGPSSDGSHRHNGIVSLYRGIANRHLWVSEVNSQTANGGGGGGDGEGEGGEIPSNNKGQSHSPTCLPPVFALVRFVRSVPFVQPLDAPAPIRQSIGGQSAGPTGEAYPIETSELGPDNGESRSSRDVPISSSCADVEDIYDWKVTSLSAAWDQRYSSDTYIVCADTSSSSTALGWGMRNVLALLATHLPLTKTAASGQKEDRNLEGNLSSSHGASAVPVANPDTEPSSECGSGGRASCNIIALRGALAKRLYNCASRDKAASLLDTLTDTQIVDSDESLFLRTFFYPNGSYDIQHPKENKEEDRNEDDESETHTRSRSKEGAGGQGDKPFHAKGTLASTGPLPRVVGWETNERGKPGPRCADLSAIMDNSSLMKQAVDLNLRLMKWRMWPTLDTEKLQETRCLLFGAGTLGCAVARALLGWGVRHITLIDNGRVSYSNPSRQCLFEFKDCEDRAFKAEAAAAHLQRIFPGVKSRGVVLTIPMPGHPLSLSPDKNIPSGDKDKDAPSLPPPLVDDNATVVGQLDDLVRSHDVCFALTDSREARWLPTVMCAAHDKLLINAALGFDSYLVMRHGSSPLNTLPLTPLTLPAKSSVPALSPQTSPVPLNTPALAPLLDPSELLGPALLNLTDTLRYSGLTHPDPDPDPFNPQLARQDTAPSTPHIQTSNSKTSSPMHLSPYTARPSAITALPSPLLSKALPAPLVAPGSNAAVTRRERVGCYFCSDIVAATNSQRDRSLDQQCTVTRPGLSFIAGALAVELMVALLHSPLGNQHPASVPVTLTRSSVPASSAKEDDVDSNKSNQGGKCEFIPHQLRGSVLTFSQISPMTSAFECCTACSYPVVRAYAEDGAEFVRRVCNDNSTGREGSYLEALSGVARLTQQVEDLDLDGMYMDSDEE